MIVFFVVLLLEVFWFSQLVHYVRHRKTVKLHWLALLLLLNFIGAAYYLRLVPRRSLNPDEFERRLNNWLTENDLSLEKGKAMLTTVTQKMMPFLGAWFLVFIAGKLVKMFHIELPAVLIYPFLGAWDFFSSSFL